MPKGIFQRKKKNIIGQRFGRLLVLKEVKGKNNQRYFSCQCDCGKLKDIRMTNLTSGITISCKCYQIEQSTKSSRISSLKHGFCTNGRIDRFYSIYKKLFQRCNAIGCAQYKWYGDRGIKVCKRWEKFDNFKIDMYGSYIQHVKVFGEKNTTIDRINVNSNYAPKNCQWATLREQGNNKRSSRFINFNGFNLTLANWSRKLNIKQSTLSQRINQYNWTIKRAFTTKP